MNVPWVAAWLAVNAFVFVLYGDDKRRARTGMWRIPERRLLLGMWLAGGVGALLGMHAFHHKTKHMIFRVCALPAAALSVAVLMLAVCV